MASPSSRAAITGCTADFTTGAVALLRTLRKHHPDIARICFSPLEQVSDVQAVLGELAEVRAIPRRLANSPDDPKVLVSWSRVFIPTVAADAVAWFDSDVILCGPSSEWWDVPAGKVNVVADRAYRIRHMVPHGMEAWYFDRFKLDAETRGFNAGIFALRPQDHQDLAERFEGVLAEQDATRQPFAFDQGILNGLLHAKAHLLPLEFNAHCLAECGVPKDVRAIHYTGSPKPWNDGYDRASEGYYHWLLNTDADASELQATRRRMLLARPRRFAGKVVRKLKALCGVREEMGVGKKPTT